jgi:hypothetical protein
LFDRIITLGQHLAPDLAVGQWQAMIAFRSGSSLATEQSAVCERPAEEDRLHVRLRLDFWIDAAFSVAISLHAKKGVRRSLGAE